MHPILIEEAPSPAQTPSTHFVEQIRPNRLLIHTLLLIVSIPAAFFAMMTLFLLRIFERKPT